MSAARAHKGGVAIKHTWPAKLPGAFWYGAKMSAIPLGLAVVSSIYLLMSAHVFGRLAGLV